MVIKNFFIFLIALLQSSTFGISAEDPEQKETKEKFMSVNCPSRFATLSENGMDTTIQERLTDHCLSYSINEEFINKVDGLIKKLHESPHLFNEVDNNPNLPIKFSYADVLESFKSIHKNYKNLLLLITAYNPNTLGMRMVYDSLLREDPSFRLNDVYKMLQGITSLISIYDKSYDALLVETLSIRARLQKLNELDSILEKHYSTINTIISEQKAFSVFMKNNLGNASPTPGGLLSVEPNFDLIYEHFKTLVQKYRTKYSYYLEQEE
jgi:hypothetical protein